MLMWLQAQKKESLLSTIKTLTMESKINIVTWNLCLGLANKKDSVTEYLASNNVERLRYQSASLKMSLTVKGKALNWSSILSKRELAYMLTLQS